MRLNALPKAFVLIAMALAFKLFMLAAVLANLKLCEGSTLNKRQAWLNRSVPERASDHGVLSKAVRSCELSGDMRQSGLKTIVIMSKPKQPQSSPRGQLSAEALDSVQEEQGKRHLSQKLLQWHLHAAKEESPLNGQRLKARALEDANSPQVTSVPEQRQQSVRTDQPHRSKSRDGAAASSRHPAVLDARKGVKENSDAARGADGNTRGKAYESKEHADEVPKLSTNQRPAPQKKKPKKEVALEQEALADPGGPASVELERRRNKRVEAYRRYREKLKGEAKENPGGRASLQLEKGRQRSREKHKKHESQEQFRLVRAEKQRKWSEKLKTQAKEDPGGRAALQLERHRQRCRQRYRERAAQKQNRLSEKERSRKRRETLTREAEENPGGSASRKVEELREGKRQNYRKSRGQKNLDTGDLTRIRSGRLKEKTNEDPGGRACLQAQTTPMSTLKCRKWRERLRKEAENDPEGRASLLLEKDRQRKREAKARRRQRQLNQEPEGAMGGHVRGQASHSLGSSEKGQEPITYMGAGHPYIHPAGVAEVAGGTHTNAGTLPQHGSPNSARTQEREGSEHSLSHLFASPRLESMPFTPTEGRSPSKSAGSLDLADFMSTSSRSQSSGSPRDMRDGRMAPQPLLHHVPGHQEKGGIASSQRSSAS